MLFTPQPLAVWGIVVICAGGRAVGGEWWAAGGRQKVCPVCISAFNAPIDFKLIGYVDIVL